ncbi:1-aminocyclopropane-1-carboxylate deaminase/D-cysteine desulfhydrase [Corallincola platygyrae]|uniref:1-aminocyclopropane-1-carboxylate deaminase/D-cysteine desulfhydrase n=1 Tax=Corallincola platygyrae TaxID=1193278 RepID=A0ABW4XQ24_9GAMM
MRALKHSSPLQELSLPVCRRHNVRLFIKRDDLLHPQISGNKWRKLKFTLLKAASESREQIVSFGGAFSNHIAALAAAGSAYGFKTTGIIRGEADPDNPTLRWAQQQGMELKFVDRSIYRQRHDSEYLTKLHSEFPKALIVPEGGTSKDALAGVGELLDEIHAQMDMPIDSLVTAVGSGGTLAGLIAKDQSNLQLLGVPVVKDASLESKIRGLLEGIERENDENWKLMIEPSWGGYGKVPAHLATELNSLAEQLEVPLEPVYTGKAFLTMLAAIESQTIPSGSRVVFLHTGGLQGLKGLAYRNIFHTPAQWLKGLPEDLSAELNALRKMA